jgi:hypothetical protein
MMDMMQVLRISRVFSISPLRSFSQLGHNAYKKPRQKMEINVNFGFGRNFRDHRLGNGRKRIMKSETI